MMRTIKIKLLIFMIWLCDLGLKNDEGADDQNEINEMIGTRNDLKQKLEKELSK